MTFLLLAEYPFRNKPKKKNKKFFMNIKIFIIVRQPTKTKLAFAAHFRFLPVEMQPQNDAVTHSNGYYLCLLLPLLVADVTVSQVRPRQNVCATPSQEFWSALSLPTVTSVLHSATLI